MADRRSPLSLTHHDYRLELTKNSEGGWQVVLPIDGFYFCREDAEAVLRDVWSDALLDARRILNTAFRGDDDV